MVMENNFRHHIWAKQDDNKNVVVTNLLLLARFLSPIVG
jgi:hypothetical protein